MMGSVSKLLASAVLVLLGFACGGRTGPAEVKAVYSFDDQRHAVELWHYGSATVATATYVSIFRGKAPEIGQFFLLEDLCEVFSAYRTGPRQVTWEGPLQVLIDVERPDPDYEGLIKTYDCDVVKARFQLVR